MLVNFFFVAMIKYNGKKYFGNNSLQFQRDEPNPYWELFIFVTHASFEGGALCSLFLSSHG